MTENRATRLESLIAVNQDDLYRYIYSLLAYKEDARDVFQETILTIAGKFDEYDSSRPFLPWACKFAYFKVLQHRDQNPRRVRFLASDVLETLAVERDAQSHILQSRLAALDQCLNKLPAADRELLRGRYNSKLSFEELAAKFKQSRRTLLRNLQRLRRWLFKCIGDEAVLGDG